MRVSNDPGPKRQPPPLPAKKPPAAASPRLGNRQLMLGLIIGGAVAGVLATVVVLVVLVIGIRIARRPQPELADAALPSTASPDLQPTSSPEPSLELPPEPEPEADRPAVPAPEQMRQEVGQAEAKPEESVQADSVPTKPPIESEPPPSLPRLPPPEPERSPVFADIHRRQNRLELPPLHSRSGSVFDRDKLNTEPQLLAKLYIPDASQCELRIEGREFAPRDGWVHRLEVLDVEAGRSWNLVSARNGDAPAAKPNVWAVFRLKDEQLTFRWQGKPPLWLPRCILTISVGGQAERCRLSSVARVAAVHVGRESPQVIPFRGLEAPWRPGDQVRVEIDFRGIAGAAFADGRTVGTDEPVTVRIPNPHVKDPSGNGAVEIEFQLEQPTEAKPPHLRVELFAFPQALTAESVLGQDVDRKLRRPLTQDALAEWRKAWDATRGQAAFACLKGMDRRVQREWLRLSPEIRQAVIVILQQQEASQKQKTERSRSETSREQPETATERSRGETSRERPGTPTEQSRNQASREQTKTAELPEEAVAAAGILGPYLLGGLEQLRQYEQAVQAADAGAAWCDAMERFWKELADQGWIHYRVYLETSEGPMDVEMTQGFEETDANRTGE